MGKYNPKIHHRRSIRLKGYDYSKAGAYFITTCCYHMKCLFGEVVDDKMILNDAGEMVHSEWLALKERFPNIELHEFVVMPNHFHGIINITSDANDELNVNINKAAVGATLVVAQTDDIIDVHDKIKANDDVNSDDKTAIDNDEGEGNHEGLPRRDSLIEQTNDPFKQNSLIDNNVNDLSEQTPSLNKTIGDMMDAFKSITTVEYIRGVKTLNWPPFNRKVWERNYYEHIIRNQQAYETISNYIINNPKKWNQDRFRK
ncbi:MAG: hypothetical protein JWQ25_1852 [Daejeonella sp.]|nr:hypothetical protein [Daejeonella sp.]